MADRQEHWRVELDGNQTSGVMRKAGPLPKAFEVARASAKRATVLVVDDDARNRELIAAHLAATHRVIEAENGETALALLDVEPVDLVLLDVMMPGQSGFDVCRRIKERPGDGFLPVLFLTALTDQEHKNLGLTAAADDYLIKPVDATELKLRVAAFLRLRLQELTIARQLTALSEAQARKNDLMSLIVHDLRSPLAGILGLLQVLVDSVGPSESNLLEDLQTVLAAGLKMRSLLDDLVQVRRLEKGECELRSENAVIADICQEAAGRAAAAAQDRSIALEVLAGTSLTAAVDRALVSRALENLLLHAVKLAPRKSIVTLSARRVDGWLELSVAHARISAAKEGEGTPLGVQLVQLIASAHGGRAVAEDRANGGALFRMLLPA